MILSLKHMASSQNKISIYVFQLKFSFQNYRIRPHLQGVRRVGEEGGLLRRQSHRSSDHKADAVPLQSAEKIQRFDQLEHETGQFERPMTT